MPKRIELPSADALFGDADRDPIGRNTPQAPRSAAPERSRAVKNPARTSAPKQAKQKRSRRAPALATQLDAVERRLGDMPIDTLLALRDDIEELLAAPDIHAVTVERVIGRV